jgi:hypothetical protein
LAVLRRICDDETRDVREANPDVPAWLAAIIHKLLSKAADDRFQTAEEVAELLQQWLAHLQQPTICQPPLFVVADRCGKAGKERKPRSWPIIAASCGVVAVTLLAGAALLEQWLRESPARLDANPSALASPVASPPHPVPATAPVAEPEMPDEAKEAPRIAVDAIDAGLRRAWTETLEAEAGLRSTGAAGESLFQAIHDLKEDIDRLEREFVPQRASVPTLPREVPANP